MRCWIVVVFPLLAAPFSLAASDAPAAAANEALNCIVLPYEQVDIGSPVPGVLAEVFVGRSERVQSGQVVARLESSVEEVTVELARSRAATDAEIELRRIEFGYDAQHRDRLQTLQLRRATSTQTLDDAERVAETARLRVRLAEDRRREASLERRRADAVLARKSIRSPIDGVVVQRHKAVGEYVETQPILRIASLDPLRVEVIAPLALFGEITEGMQIGVRTEIDPDTERLALVTAVDAVADPGSGTFGVELELPNPDLKLPAGIKCKGRLLPQVVDSSPASVPGRLQAAGAPGSARTAGQAPPVDETSGERPAGAAASELPVLPAPEACLVFESVDDKAHAQALVLAAERLGALAGMSEDAETRAVGFVVATPVQPQPEAQQALAGRLREAGIEDLALIRRGDFAGRVGLGVYNGPLSARRRQAALAEFGFETEVLSRTQTHRAWRVDVRLPSSVEADAALAILGQAGGQPVPDTHACEPLQTAAR